jgi:CheY-like chemotaxis protein/predicted regulator of Ras-like GTPase activity (Roadblock/LC7/MglB family)
MVPFYYIIDTTTLSTYTKEKTRKTYYSKITLKHAISLFQVVATMSEQWRILVVEADEHVKRNTVNSLHNDGYFVQSAGNWAEALRVLWTEAFDVVIGDLKTPGDDDLEMLQWLRAYRPQTRMIMVAADASPASRSSALEGGAVSFLRKPLDLHLLKEELRRLLQQTGFSASLDSFDLLDVIQIITMSRKGIALVVDTGPEERGILCFQGGELVWAEYGTLHGEEAFFALAAYKNGTVTQQAWQEQLTPNVTQPLSRLIFQALQYRSKYSLLQSSGEHEALPAVHALAEEDADRPFLVLGEPQREPVLIPEGGPRYRQEANADADSREWWQPTDKIGGLSSNGAPGAQAYDNMETPAIFEQVSAEEVNAVSASGNKTAADQHGDLPSWLTELPAKFDMPMDLDIPILRPAARAHAAPDEWQPLEELHHSTTAPGPLQALSAGRTTEATPAFDAQSERGEEWGRMQSGALQMGRPDAQRAVKRNYPALVSALQTIGYSIPGFIAAAVVGLDGQPIAQVAIDDLDISPTCAHFSRILQSALHALADGAWGGYEDTIITSGDRYILLRIVANDTDAFQVLITSRASDPAESLEVMANVEGTIGAALH